jgi:hypothetical protein
MRNVHVLATDKPSRLGQSVFDNSFHYNPIFFYELEEKRVIPQNIYITNDEEIKGGDWVFDIFKNSCPVIRQLKTEEEILNVQKTEFKIILTDNEDLIKDGVQAIDDKFLEWFVKNPSCERVEVEIILLGKVEGTTMSVSKYKIIIPKEEPKQDTLEKAAEKLFPFTKDDYENRIITIKRLFWIDGAKWQQERNENKYSEEEVKDILIKYLHYLTINDESNADEWFEQFKK